MPLINKMTKFVFSAFIIFLTHALSAQVAYNSTTPPDSATGYTYASNDSATGSEGVVAKPYIRVKMALDSITNLITYKEIVEQEESQEDSLYIRCLKLIKRKFGVYGKMIPVNKQNEKIQVQLQMPVYVRPNTFTKSQAGTVQFLFTLDIKAGRYRYRIDNIQHIPAPTPLNDQPKPVYLEYYLESKVNVKSTDLVLKGADEEIKKFITELKKKLKEPLSVDEDDW
jgi:hypothetical protein